MPDTGYVNYYTVLGLKEGANPGEVRKTYKRNMKALVMEIARAEITDERRSHYLQEMAKLNAALYILRDKEFREDYWTLRAELIELEAKWCAASGQDEEESDRLRRAFDSKLRYFLSKFVEEAMLESGRDKECVEISHWDRAHERHASRILRHYRHHLYQEIQERLPFYEVTKPALDWDERARAVDAILSEGPN